jgi:hypothetical protein
VRHANHELHTAHPLQMRVLEAASRLGMSIELLQCGWYTVPDWPYKPRVNQFVGINDCIYWNRYRFEHIAIVDTDEFISPRSTETLPHYMKSVESRVPNVSQPCY